MQRKKIKQLGFSLAELSLAIGLSGVVALATVSSIKMLSTQTNVQTESIQQIVEQLGSYKVLQKDIYDSTHSFNNVNLTDDKGKPFFDHLANPYCSPSQVSKCGRTIQLKVPVGSDKSRYFYLLVVNNRKGLRFEIRPEQSFPLDKNGNVIRSGYVGLNNPKANKYSIDLTNNPHNPTTAYSPWAKDELIFLFTSSTYSPSDSIIPRPIIFLGQVSDNGGDLTSLSVAERESSSVSLIKNLHPLTNNPIPTTRHFMLNLTQKAGMPLLLYIEGVSLIRYSLERDSQKNTVINFFRTEAIAKDGKLNFDNGRKILLLKNVKSVTFSRPTISSPVISYDVEMEPK